MTEPQPFCIACGFHHAKGYKACKRIAAPEPPMPGGAPSLFDFDGDALQAEMIEAEVHRAISADGQPGFEQPSAEEQRAALAQREDLGSESYWLALCELYEAELRELRAEVDRLREENARLLDNPGANRVGKFSKQSEEARLAALRTKPTTGTKRAHVLELLTAAYPRGLSDEQIQNFTHYDIRSCNARRKELEEGGWVVKAPWRWHAPSGNEVSVWMLSATAAEELGVASRV